MERALILGLIVIAIGSFLFIGIMLFYVPDDVKDLKLHIGDNSATREENGTYSFYVEVINRGQEDRTINVVTTLIYGDGEHVSARHPLFVPHDSTASGSYYMSFDETRIVADTACSLESAGGWFSLTSHQTVC